MYLKNQGTYLCFVQKVCIIQKYNAYRNGPRGSTQAIHFVLCLQRHFHPIQQRENKLYVLPFRICETTIHTSLVYFTTGINTINVHCVQMSLLEKYENIYFTKLNFRNPNSKDDFFSYAMCASFFECSRHKSQICEKEYLIDTMDRK